VDAGGGRRGLRRVPGFAGDDVERAVFFPEDDRFLVEREPTVSHFDVTESGRG
jgi:hypothetical protein